MDSGNRFQMNFRCPGLFDSHDSATSRDVQKQAERLEQELNAIMDDVSRGVYTAMLTGSPSQWQGFHHGGPPQFDIIAADLNGKYFITFQKLGVAPDLQHRGLRNERKGSVIQVNDGALQVSDHLQMGGCRIPQSSEPEILVRGERKSIIHPSPGQWSVGSAIDSDACYTSVTTWKKMFIQDQDYSGFRELSDAEKKGMIDEFVFYNSGGTA